MEGYCLQKNENIAIHIVFENFGLPKKKEYYTSFCHQQLLYFEQGKTTTKICVI
jgi:hypothetical protein